MALYRTVDRSGSVAVEGRFSIAAIYDSAINWRI